jgi:hypothetical protein
MNTKAYKIQNQTFSLQSNTLDVKKYGARMLARLRKLAYEYTKDADFSVLENYSERKHELETAKNQIQELIDTNTDENGYELTEAKKREYIFRINEYEVKLKGIVHELENDASAQKIMSLKAELETCAMIELLSDNQFIAETFGKLLTGDISKLDFSAPEAMHFVTEVMHDFFCLMSGSA